MAAGGGATSGAFADETPVAAAPAISRPDAVSFARDIRPILSQHCGSCHGADEATREAGLRLDVRESAVKRAIVPGDPDASTLIARVESADEGEQMPPPEAKKPLSARQKELLRAWVAQGAVYAPHWAFLPPERVEPPALESAAGAHNGIDYFVRARLAQEGVAPAAEAPRETLLRRLTLDLTGLPPTLAELDEFLVDRSPDGYEKVVDRLLDSPRHAERMAMHWLDVARYADTNGYNNDEERTMWPWRNWVIDAFRRNLPYDRFVIEQLAGDLLPEGTLSQRIATGFNRNHVLTTEGGIIPDEYRVEYVADRVHTTATVFMGLSFQCARCHDHKYDPVSQREYYSFFAYFNQQPDEALNYNKMQGYSPPYVKVPSDSEREKLADLGRRKTQLEQALRDREATAPDRIASWEKTLSAEDRLRLSQVGLVLHVGFDDAVGKATADTSVPGCTGIIRGAAQRETGKVGGALVFDGETFVDFGEAAAFEATDKFSIAAWVLWRGDESAAVVSKIDDANGFRGYDVILEGGKVAAHLVDRWPDNAIKVITRERLAGDTWHHIAVTCDGSRKAAGIRIYIDGKPQATDAAADRLTGSVKTDKPLYIGRRRESAPFRGLLDDVRFYGSEMPADAVARLAALEPAPGLDELVALPEGDRTAETVARLRRLYLDQIDVDYRNLRTELEAATAEIATVDKQVPGVMVMEDMPQPRATPVLHRGQYDQPRDVVSPGVPAALPALPAGLRPTGWGWHSGWCSPRTR